MKRFLKPTGLAAGILLGGAATASAALLDFTDLSDSTYGARGATAATGAIGGVGWTLTGGAGGALSYNAGADAPGGVGGLAGAGDGIGLDEGAGGVSRDEVAFGEYLTLVFDRNVTVTGLHFLDLFEARDGSSHELALIFSGSEPVGTPLQEVAAQQVVGELPTARGTGYAFEAAGITGSVFSFTSASSNDNLGDADFALAGLDVEIAPIPIPGAGLLLTAALGGLAIARRRRS